MSEREQIEQSIAALEAQRAILGDAVLDPAIAALRRRLAELKPPPPIEQQRKQITVLFADVSGFTAMSEPMDAEDVTEVMNALWGRLDTAITEHGGLIDKHMGDAVMALWGAEQAREDDPERAIRGALAMQGALASFREERGVPLAMRIGINTGPVILGEVGTTDEYTAIGDTVNTARRVEQATPRGRILISHDTYRHVRGIFDLEVLEPIQVKGKVESIQAYLVQRAKPRAFRRGVRGLEGVETRMIGRKEEFRRLQDAFYAIESGQCQMITVVGEAGVGKSRLLYEFENWLDLLPQTIRYFKGRASLETQTLPYALIRDLFACRFQIQDSDPAGMVRDKIEQGIGELFRGDQKGQMKAHFIGQWLGFDFSQSPHLRGILNDAEQIRGRAQGYLCQFFQITTERDPTVIFLEDVHWADDSSLDVLAHLASTMLDRRLLIVCLTRPTLFERRAGWTQEQAFHTRLELLPLSKEDSRQLVEEILQRVERVPEALRELVVSGAEGNPFYVEELIKMLIEDGVIITSRERWRVEPARLTTVRVPSTLTGVLQARLDSLPWEERVVLQQASVVGRLFWDSAVAHISASVREAADVEGVPQVLSALGRKEMVFQRGVSTFVGVHEYIFKHALLREVTYESVLKRLRRIYHGLVAEWLVKHGGERVGEYAGLIADHLELAGHTEQAAVYLRQAGEGAAARFANTEAVSYLSRALDMVPEVNQAERYDLLLVRERVYDLQGKREAQAQDLANLEALAEALDDDQRRAETALRRAAYCWAIGDFPGAVAFAQTAIGLARATRDTAREARGHFLIGRILWNQGKFEEAHAQLEKAQTLAQAVGLGSVEADSLRNIGNVYWHQGHYDWARSYHEQALRIHREIGDRRGESTTLNSLGLVASTQNDQARARTCYEQALHICREMGDRYLEGMVSHNLARVALDQGDFASAIAYGKRALRIRREVGDREGEGETLNYLGRVFHSQGDLAEAKACFEQALSIFQDMEHRLYVGWTLGSLGWLFRDWGDYAEAKACFGRALHIYREMGNQRYQAGTLHALGMIACDLGDLAAARAQIEQALCIFHQVDDRGGENWTRLSLSLVFHYLGDDETACEYGQQAVLTAQELNNLNQQGAALTCLGHALSGLGRLSEAADAYREALKLRRELNRHILAMEPLAGLARLSLARGACPESPSTGSGRAPLGIEGVLIQALVHVEEILTHLETGTLDGTDEPFHIYLTCYQVLAASHDPRAREVLTIAHTLLQERAARILDEAVRRSFLEDVPYHREIVAEWQRMNTESD